ncbi:hypothetical protein FT663_01566 [Candidozyma haemuli var. vulneris]|nr:hypothetical protein FT662_04357 [[Candida] haemuloni var. vulneris]KAF3994335.1 hypothetical protein FT663_01566 [[Candida] haemuloni var. vulneris]
MVDRQTIIFVIIMVIFFTLPPGSEQPLASEDREVLQKFKSSLIQSRRQVFDSQYWLGYGNLTGLKLSYQDNVEKKNVSLWPFRDYSKSNPWKEREQDSILPNEVSKRVNEHWGNEPVLSSGDHAYPLNISGQLFGDFDVVKPSVALKPLRLRLPRYLKDYYSLYKQEKYEEEKQRYESDPETNSPPQEIEGSRRKAGNITTFNEGKMELELHSLGYNYLNPELADFVKNNPASRIEDAIIVTMGMNLKDYPETHDDEFKMLGVYFQSTGALVASTKSAKFQGGHALPHFTMNEKNFNVSKTLMSQIVNVTDIEQEVSIDDMNNAIERSQDQCEYITYFQLDKTEYTREQLRAIDDELISPQGAPIPKRLPQLEITHAVVYSPDCGILLENKKSETFGGIRMEISKARVRQMAIGVLLLTAIELNLLLRQMKRCRSPGQLSNVSSVTVSMLGFWMSVTLVYFLLRSLQQSELYLILTCVSVIASLLCLNQMRLLVSVFTAQENERGTNWWEILRGSSVEGQSHRTEEEANQQGTPEDNGNTNEAVAPATTAATAAQTNTIQQLSDEARYPNMIFFVGFALTCIAMMLISGISTWRITYRRTAEYVILLGFNSYWIPQFFRSTLKNRTRVFSWEYAIGTSLVRFIPIFYMCLDKNNAVRHHHDPVMAVVVFSWVFTQLFFLYLQDCLGARFWVKENWLPEQYNYHPIINIKDLESGFSSDILANMRPQSADKDLAICDIDCAICMSTLQVPVVSGEHSAASKKNVDNMMKEIMVTPCRHIFHVKCLEDWMVYKLQCPVCRCALPPV